MTGSCSGGCAPSDPIENVVATAQLGDQLGDEQRVPAGDLGGPPSQRCDPPAAAEQPSDELGHLVVVEAWYGYPGSSVADTLGQVVRVPRDGHDPEIGGIEADTLEHGPGGRSGAFGVVQDQRQRPAGERPSETVDHVVGETEGRRVSHDVGHTEQSPGGRSDGGLQREHVGGDRSEQFLDGLKGRPRVLETPDAHGACLGAGVRQVSHERGLSDPGLAGEDHQPSGGQPLPHVLDGAGAWERPCTDRHVQGRSPVLDHGALRLDEERARLEPEVVPEPPASLLVGGQGIGTSPRSLQRHEQLCPAALVVW